MRCVQWAVMALLFAATLRAGQPGDEPEPPACEPGYRWVQEDSFKEVERRVCKVVPSVKKVRKVNYDTKPDPFCVRLASFKALFGGKSKCDGPGCVEDCPKCTGPYSREILVKTEVIREESTTKCVYETVVEKVPCKDWRKVPCDPTKGPQSADPTKR
jgi:hypothetical protein